MTKIARGSHFAVDGTLSPDDAASARVRSSSVGPGSAPGLLNRAPKRVPHVVAGEIEYHAGPPQVRRNGRIEFAHLRSKDDIVALHERADRRELTLRDVPKRPHPTLANSRDLLRETRQILAGKVDKLPPNLLVTTYGGRTDKSPAENIAANLILDVNICFEQELQKHLEHDRHFTDSAKAIVELIHRKLNIQSLPATHSDGSLRTAAKAERMRYVEEKLTEYFPRAELEAFLKSNNWWFKENLNKLRDIKRTDKSFTPAENRRAEGLLGLLKMLKTQTPYFGGSVEYNEHIDNSLEFWLYHLSTLTKDPDRQFHGSDRDSSLLPKPLMDYQTNRDGDVAFMNQRNLGTGVVESDWHQLPHELRDEMQSRLQTFAQGVGQHGDRKLPGSAGSAVTLWNALDRVARKEGVEPGALTVAQLWHGCDEDERKAIYADMCRIPWSDAHLVDGGGALDSAGPSFERTFSTQDAADEIRGRHPPRTAPGLMNVVGIRANILETPLTAGGRYMAEGGQVLERLLAEGRFKNLSGQPVDKTLLQDFVAKHERWHRSAFEHHKPIVGGVSGHTLAYHNLYAAALEKCSPAETLAAPSLETLRGILLAGLVGNKLHHSVDEVYSASTAVKYGAAHAPRYVSRDSYADVFESTDPHIAKAAREALDSTRQRYVKFESESVLSTLPLAKGTAGRQAVVQSVLDYVDRIGSSQPAIGRQAKSEIERAVIDGLTPKWTPPDIHVLPPTDVASSGSSGNFARLSASVTKRLDSARRIPWPRMKSPRQLARRFLNPPVRRDGRYGALADARRNQADNAVATGLPQSMAARPTLPASSTGNSVLWRQIDRLKERFDRLKTTLAA